MELERLLKEALAQLTPAQRRRVCQRSKLVDCLSCRSLQEKAPPSLPCIMQLRVVAFPFEENSEEISTEGVTKKPDFS